MSNFREVFTRIHPFASDLLLHLDIWDTAALSLTCRDVYNHIRQHPIAFSKFDLRDPAAVRALHMLVENDRHHQQSQRHSLCDFLTRVYHACYSTDRLRRVFIPALAFQTLVLEHHVKVRVMLLDGIHVRKWMLSEVLRITAPTLEVLSLVFTSGCRFDEFVDMFNKELELKKLRELKVWGMGQGQQSSIRPHRTDIIDPSNWIDWSNELLLRLQTVAELRGVQLDTTLCSLSDHPGCRISLCVARLCGICGVKGFETQCNYCAAQAFCRNEPTCTLCGSFYCHNCVTSNLALVSGAMKVYQMCPKCEEVDNIQKCAGCGVGSIFTRAPNSGDSLRSCKAFNMELGDLQPCYICNKWYCGECLGGIELNCDNCWNHACTTCIIEQHMASTNWSTQKFFETVCRTAGGKSDSFIDPVMKRWLELKERLTIGTNESLSGVGPSTHAVKPNPDMDKEIIALILIPCALCDQQYLCSDCQDDPECDWPYQCLEDEFCTECGRLITFWEWDADPSEYEYDPSESEDDYSESSDKESGWSDGL